MFPQYVNHIIFWNLNFSPFFFPTCKTIFIKKGEHAHIQRKYTPTKTNKNIHYKQDTNNQTQVLRKNKEEKNKIRKKNVQNIQKGDSLNHFWDGYPPITY